MSGAPGIVPLPIDPLLGEAVAQLRRHRALVVTAPPGSGKTTRLPAALVDSGLDGAVLVLEPRRLAARAAARRVAAERGVPLGDEVGYQVRHDDRTSRRTRLAFVTEGILVRRLCGDPFLEGVAAVVLDEFHERHLDTDLALAMLQEVRETVRNDLLVVVMSATLDPGPVATFLGGCPVLEGGGRQHRVEIRHLDRPRGPRDRLEDAVRTAVDRALVETAGDLLVFLPGLGEIARCERALAELCRRRQVEVLPLHGALAPEQQDRAIARGPGRKVVLATNVAESSVTIDGVSAVVDAGLARVLRHDPARGLDALRVERISLASATQRAGRAGRTGPGVCYRLWTAAEERSMPAFETPEIRRADLAGPALTVAAFAARSPERFGWFDPPESQALAAADALLRRLGALDAVGRVTAQGREMLRMPLHPRLARAMLEARRFGCERSVAEVAALLSERDFVLRPGPGEPEPSIELGDRLERLRAVERDRFDPAGCRARGVDRSAARAVARARDQIAAGARDRPGLDPAFVGRALLAGFVDRVVRPRGPSAARGTMVGGRGVVWANGALDEEAELLLALDVGDAGDRRTSTESRLRLCAPLEREWLLGLVEGEPRAQVDAEFDEDSGRAFALRRTTFLGLVLDESRGGVADPAAVERALGVRLAADPERWLGGREDLAALRARVAWLCARAPELGLPELDDAAVVAAAIALLPGRRSLRDLQDAPLCQAVVAGWTPAQRQALAARAPERVRLPSGREARIDYTAGPEPVLAVRLQELFGTERTPAADGQPLVLHLLGPNHRPVQVTRDLPSFWANVYPRVRSELRRRYPKHSWPEDPTTAAAESRPRRRGSG
jgi:ATP-dependent helicase HrpB